MEPCRSSGRVPGFGNLRQVKPNRAGSNLPRNRCRCLVPPATTHGGGSGHSSSPATSVPRRTVSEGVFHLLVVRSRAPLLQPGLPRTRTASTAPPRQRTASAKSRRTARSSRPPAGIPAPLPASANPRDGSSFPFDHLPGIIPMWTRKVCRKRFAASDRARRSA